MLENRTKCLLIFVLSDQDAASLSIAMLKKKIRGQIFLGCDNHPLSRLARNIHICEKRK